MAFSENNIWRPDDICLQHEQTFVGHAPLLLDYDLYTTTRHILLPVTLVMLQSNGG